ncbi:aminoglycoside phosphotransferase [Pochonia chlamydosporia 170]|uniref:Aminoglycoside phosphotransferase n=1 Tax=Pochonia chlamydosporia 170 TaxID=1380566 RepID=A0A179F2L8_METCM|nr:aminoglycoside phosphotransferase [Pochonia chlamydosporia 170]OAQ59631.1 aminoglycoside phosphotransferase [Pochonia chlamydosporia 170]
MAQPSQPAAEIILRTLHGEITYEEAADQETNVLPDLTYWRKMDDFGSYLLDHKKEIEDVVSRYLRLDDTEKCCLSPPPEWNYGSFNLCLPAFILNWKKRPGGRVMIRFPLPFKVGESDFPGNSDEKLRSEVATYAWIDKNCPEVPLPYLWGFAFAGGPSFSALDTAPFLSRLFEKLRRQILSLLGYAVPCQYMQLNSAYNLNVGHMVIDYIEPADAEMLSLTWETKRHDERARANLFRGLSRIMLALGKVPLQRIGSFTMDNQGVISLTNRPLRLQLHQLENEGIPTNISRSTTYTSIEPFLHDILACHDSRLRHQLNAANDEADCRAQMAVLSAFRTILPLFVRRDLRSGPFILTLTDMHASNIFVDTEWNIKYLIDLEWACSLPLEMLHPPSWLSDEPFERLSPLFDEFRQEFIDIFMQEEAVFFSALQHQRGPQVFTETMRQGWEAGNFFYFLALESVTGLYFIFQRRIRPRFDPSDHCLDEALSVYWGLNSEQFIASKVQQKQEYDEKLKQAFKCEDN